MELEIIRELLERVHGATFATLDSETMVRNGVRCVTEGERVIIFRTKGGSGYGNMVNRRLQEAGKSPSFRVGPLPWGERVDDLPLIQNKGKFYLQTIVLAEGKKEYFVGNTDVRLEPELLSAYGIRPRFIGNQGLPREDQVLMNTYNIENLRRIVLMGEEVFDTSVVEKGRRSVLKISE